MVTKVLASQALPSEILASKRVLVFCNSFFLHLDHRFDHAGLLLGPTGKFGDRVREFSAMGNPRRRIDTGVFHEANDAGEICGARVSAGQNGELASMEIRIVEGNLPLEQPDENQSAPIGRVGKSAHHRFGVSGGVENRGRQITRGYLLQRFERVIDGGVDQVGHTELFAAERQALRIDIEDNDFGSSLNRKLYHGQSDRARSNQLIRSDLHPKRCKPVRLWNYK